jgi:hypothetical protein
MEDTATIRNRVIQPIRTPLNLKIGYIWACSRGDHSNCISFHAVRIRTKYLNAKRNILKTLKCLALVSILLSVFYSAAMECGTIALADDAARAGEI